ncbi:MAG TPA: DUF423 domain-containing protein [Acetobacteraceae bacterium]|nr:DUF423 domain-containing protein [Acetobacteraceae bacterium]
MSRLWLAIGALSGLGAVALSAWAAHGLPQRLEPARLAAVQNALTIQGWHALALLAAGFMAERGGLFPNLAGGLFATGMVLFCGAVWVGALRGISLGPVAPTGGMILMAGWLALFVAALRR